MKERNQSLDVFRGAAVLMVIAHHYAKDEQSILHVGGMGVDLFFVLSGFLISGLLFSEIQSTGTLKLGRFLIRRGFKIYPAYYAFLLITLPLVPGNEHSRLWPEVLFLQQYIPHVWQHTWSLSVEETFYVAIPVLIGALYRMNILRYFPLTALLICGVLTWLRLRGAEPIRLEGLALGSALGYFDAFHRENFRRLSGWWVLPLAGVFLLPAFAFQHSRAVFTTNIIAFGFAVYWAIAHPSFSLRGVTAVGRYSYSIYLWHMPVAMFWWTIGPLSVLGFAGNACCAVFLGIVMGKLVEIPALKVRERYFPSLARQAHHCSFQEPRGVGIDVAET